MDLNTVDLSSFMDNFGPSKIAVIKTSDLRSSMDYFHKMVKKIKTGDFGWLNCNWSNKFFDSSNPFIRKECDGEEKEKEQKMM